MSSNDRNKPDSYWRIKTFKDSTRDDIRPLAQAAGYPVKNNIPRGKLVHWARRMELRLFCYYKCDKHELRKFATDRGLVRDLLPLDKDSLVQLLMAADDERKFEKFMDLPPELRGLVYGWYIAAFPATLLTPTQPPLARTSRLLRKECLSVFYSECRFELLVPCVTRDDRTNDRTIVEFRFQPETLCFLNGLTEENWADVKKLLFSIDHRLKLYVTLPIADAAFDVNIQGSLWWIYTGAEAVAKGIKTEVSAAIEMMQQREGRRRLSVKDIYDMRNAAEKGYLSVLHFHTS